MHRRIIQISERHLGRRGFTLTELLVLLAILGLVFGLLIPLWNVDREKQRRVVCAFHLKQIGVALAAYASDHTGHLPTSYYNKIDGKQASWDAMLAPTYISIQNLACPSDKLPRHLPSKIIRSYAIFFGGGCNSGRFFVQGSRLPCRWLPDPANTVVVAERVSADSWFGRVGGVGGDFCRLDQVASPHVKGEPAAGNYLFLDGHVAWETNPPTNYFPSAPDPKIAGFVPCP